MVKRIIPGNMSPWECEINDVKYVYPPGTEQMVPEAVAHVIDAWYASQEPKYPEPEQPEGGGGSVTPEQVEDAVEEAMLENGIIKRSLLPEGYPYNAMTEILSVTGGAMTDDGYPVTQPLGLVVGNTYEVLWNGTLYSCVAESYDMEGVVFALLGDAGVVGGGEPTGKYPFVMIEMPEGMTEGGVYAAVIPLDGSETVSFTVFGSGNIPIDRKWLPEGYPYIVEAGVTVLQETTLTADTGNQFSLPVFLNKDTTYKVTWNGTDYTVAPQIPDNSLGVEVCWGSPEIFGLEQTEEPFLICISSAGCFVLALDASTAPTIKIVTERSYVPMSEKYLPGGGLRLVNGKNVGSLRTTNASEEDESYTMGMNAIALGTHTKASETNSVAIGNYSEDAGMDAIAIGSYSTASGQHSIAIGGSSGGGGRPLASGNISVAVGLGISSGELSYAEGFSFASGDISHAEGHSTAAGEYSHAEGKSEAASECQHTQGKYNIIDEEGKYAHIVGNGVGGADHSRSNAHTLDWDGNAWFAGSVEGTALILTSPGGKRFKVTVDDSGNLAAAEITE